MSNLSPMPQFSNGMNEPGSPFLRKVLIKNSKNSYLLISIPLTPLLNMYTLLLNCTTTFEYINNKGTQPQGQMTVALVRRLQVPQVVATLNL